MMNRLTFYAVVMTTAWGATLAGCSKEPATQAEANVAQAQATGAESVSAAQDNLTKTETSSDKSNAAANLQVASAESTSAHDVAVARCAEKPVAERPDCTNEANDALTAANQKAADAQTAADNAKPVPASAAQ
jgi:hypothetical protein